MSLRAWVAIASLCLLTGVLVAADPTAQIDRIHKVAKEGAGNAEAAKAWKELVQQGPSALLPTLRALNTAQPEAANWLRSAVDALAEKELKAGKRLPHQQLEAFVRETTNQARARRLAYEWLCRADPKTPERLLPGMFQDPSPELRRDAVAVVMKDAKALLDKGEKPAATDAYRKALEAARDRDQVDETAKQLKGLGVTVDLAAHFGFIQKWHVIGPFDSTEGKGYSAVYPPEKGVDLKATYKGKKEAELQWKEHVTPHAYGMVDFNKALSKNMACAGYAFAVVNSPKEQTVELRMESNNAIKLFCNGQLVYAHEEYHHGHKMDQYAARVTLKAGRNEILVKVAQNEQKDEWAQQWMFHLRVCDSVGTAIRF